MNSISSFFASQWKGVLVGLGGGIVGTLCAQQAVVYTKKETYAEEVVRRGAEMERQAPAPEKTQQQQSA